jgi:hypothetical protein
MSDNQKIKSTHLQRHAYVYVRQSTAAQGGGPKKLDNMLSSESAKIERS